MRRIRNNGRNRLLSISKELEGIASERNQLLLRLEELHVHESALKLEQGALPVHNLDTLTSNSPDFYRRVHNWTQTLQFISELSRLRVSLFAIGYPKLWNRIQCFQSFNREDIRHRVELSGIHATWIETIWAEKKSWRVSKR